MSVQLISVIVCSRNRAESAARTVRSLLANPDESVELVVVDQSDNDETQHALDSFRDARLTYIRSKASGKGAAINEGLAHVSGAYVAFTDDDCEASPGWLAGIVLPLIERPKVALVFSNVTASDEQNDMGYIPTYIRSADRELRRVRDVCGGWGLGAGMAVRRDTLVELGGADEFFGPGARFPSADDLDLELRFLLKGWHVYETAQVEVVHHGFRSWAEGRAHTVRDWSALGGCIGKLLRSGHLRVVPVAVWMLSTRAIFPVLSDIAHLRKPRIRRITSFVAGFWSAIRLPVDRQLMKFAVPR